MQAGLAMNTEDVHKKHLRELLTNKQVMPAWSEADPMHMPGNPQYRPQRPDYPVPRSIAPGYMPPRMEAPADPRAPCKY